MYSEDSSDKNYSADFMLIKDKEKFNDIIIDSDPGPAQAKYFARATSLFAPL